MFKMRLMACFAVASLILATVSHGANQSADTAWARLTEPVDGVAVFAWPDAAKLGFKSQAWWQWNAKGAQQFRDRGLEFWKNYPNDPRKWQWFLRTVTQDPPHYWADYTQGAMAYAEGAVDLAILDREAMAKWDKEYMGLRAAYLYHHCPSALPECERDEVAAFRETELRWQIDQAVQDLRVRGIQLNWQLFANKLIDLDGAASLADGSAVTLSREFLDYLSEASDLDTEAGFIAALKEMPSKYLVQLAQGYERLGVFRDRPFNVPVIADDGLALDWAALHGKMVLVDIWSLTCSDCIENLPKIKKIYDKYREHGFEVIGICEESVGEKKGADKVKFLKVLSANHINWTNYYIQSAEALELDSHYGVYGLPVTWLLDRDGKFVRQVMDIVKFESQIPGLLKLTSSGRNLDTNGNHDGLVAGSN